jgi:transposase
MTAFAADAHSHVQRMISVVKMVTVLEKYTIEEQRSIVHFQWAKGLNAKNIHEEMCPIYGGKCLSRKTVHSWVDKFSQGRSKAADAARQGAEVAETKVKRLLRCGFRRTGKAMGQVYLCWWRVCREVNGLT